MSKKDAPATVRMRANTTPSVVSNLARWLRECLYMTGDDPETTVRFVRIICRQLVKGNKRGEEVLFMDVPRKADDGWTETAALEIYGRLQTETATLGGLQKYALYAYHSGDTEQHTSRHVIRIQGIDDDDEGDDLNSESADKNGLTSQAMRHAEIYAKLMTGSQMAIAQTYQGLVSRLSGMVEKLLDDKIEGIETLRALMDDKDERDIRLVQARTKAKGIDQIVDRLSLLLPSAINKMAGKPIIPVAESAAMMTAKGFVNSLICNNDQMEKIISVLSPEQVIAFTSLVETLNTTKDEPKKDE